MAEQSWRPGTMVYPVPAVLVTCGTSVADSNMITVAWTGTICSEPAMCYISVRPSRHSYEMIKGSMEFTINLTTVDMAQAVDWAGVKSGREFNKWEKTGLTPEKGEKVSCPYIKESPLSIECRVKEIVKLGTHDMFIAEVINILAEESLIESDSGRFRLDRAGLLAYSHGAYYELGKEIGRFGWSVKKKK